MFDVKPGCEMPIPQAYHDDVKAIMLALGFAVNNKQPARVVRGETAFSYYLQESHTVVMGVDKMAILYHELTHAYQEHDLSDLDYLALTGAKRLAKWLKNPAELEARSVEAYYSLWEATPPFLFRKWVAGGKIPRIIKYILKVDSLCNGLAVLSGVKKSDDPMIHNFLRGTIRKGNFI